ncbi:MAG: hypothetical protein Solumvirus1_3 [Solumvirus sp.]|uniref:Uncharacterized protein n=1 Tax=Solumvirus sp. TaxID=2487773 RepID=A0A3G5AG80_9VIRU|nr:MAG: hypothetical protein Solumvirus1_3 [Solumvirus sp.]
MLAQSNTLGYTTGGNPVLPITKTPFAGLAGASPDLANAGVTITSLPKGEAVLVSPARPASPRRTVQFGDVKGTTTVITPAAPAVFNVTVPPGPGSMHAAMTSQVVDFTQAPASLAQIARASPRSASSLVYGQKQLPNPDGKQPIHSQLIKLGYQPLESVVTQGGASVLPQIHYIKACDSAGRIVYILMDQAGYSAVSTDNRIYLASNRATVLPLAAKRSALENAHGASGVIFECKGLVCALLRHPHGGEEETNFTHSEKISDSIGILEGERAYPYPIVRYSELIANPAIISKIIRDSTVNIGNSEYQKIQKMFTDLDEARAKANLAYERFKAARESAFNSIKKDISTLNGFNDKIEHGVSADESQVMQIRENLAVRNRLIPTLFHQCKEVGMLKQDYEAITNKIDAATTTMTQISDIKDKNIVS